MAALLSLANETLLQIIDETRPDEIWMFVRCCKRIWILGEKQLKRHRQDISRYREPNFSEHDPETYDFLSEVLFQPHRALYVNQVTTVSRGYWFSGIARLRPMKWTLIMLDDICDLFVKTIGCPYIQGAELGKWVEELRRGHTNAALCLILTILPNLKALTLSLYIGQGYSELICEISRLNKSRHCAIPNALPLNKLETVTIDDTWSVLQNDEHTGIYEACMTLPSLRVLKGKFIGYAFDRWPPEEDFPWVSNVTEIFFEYSAFDAEAFTRVFMRIRNLQRLTYHFSRLESYKLIPISGDFTATSLKSVLEQYTARTLTHLDLGFDEESSHENEHFIGSLRQLQVLRHLRIQTDVFIDYRSRHDDLNEPVDLLPLLPASIETLILLSPTKEVPVKFTLKGLTKKREECLPSMKEFVCEDIISIAEGLKDECAAVGIDLVYPSTSAYGTGMRGHTMVRSDVFERA